MSRPALALATSADSADPAVDSPTLESALVWRGDRLADRAGQGDAATLQSGHALLDAQLPGGGWPVGALVELLQSGPAQFDWQLLASALAGLLARQGGPLVLVGGPDLQTAGAAGLSGSGPGRTSARPGARALTPLLEPFGPALAARGVPAERLLWVRADATAARLWATEQALRCTPVAAVLAWLPRVQTAALRRLHMAAQAHGKPLFVLRPDSVRGEASPAPLRLHLSLAHEAIAVGLFKRRGPPLTTPLELAARPAHLAALLDATHARRAGRTEPPPRTNLARIVALPRQALRTLRKDGNALDRVACRG